MLAGSHALRKLARCSSRSVYPFDKAQETEGSRSLLSTGSSCWFGWGGGREVRRG